MNETVIFSAVGGHDPVANFHDGAMIHVCRVYQPNKLYLYLSKEMLDRQQYDERYTKALELLQKEEGFKIEQVELIEKDELVNVHLFDAFYFEFEKIINKIVTENPDAEVYVNLSSGTPAMKNALNLIASLSEFRVKPIQVSTPNKKENPKEDSPYSFDLESYWECNMDSQATVNRCEEIKNVNLLAKIKKEIIIKMINAYDYAAALEIAEDISQFLPLETMNLLRFAKSRIMLDQSSMTKHMDQNSRELLPIQTGNEKEIFEYILTLQIKQKREDYADFIRGITPVILDILEVCLKNKFGIDIRRFCTKIKSGGTYIYKLDLRTLDRDDQGRQCKQIIQNALNGRAFKAGPYNSMHIMWLIEGLSTDPKLVDNVKKIRRIESEARNIPAHEIVSVTEQWIEKRVNMNPAEIVKLIKRLTVQSGIAVKESYWDSYDYMNNMIREKLNI